MDSLEVYQIVNILGFILGLALGAIGQKKQFCFSGSIKDYILTKSTMRASSVIMAMIVAIISTTLLSNYFEIDFSESNYYRENLNYFSIIFGGLLFGAGMMISDGCSNRHLIKFAQGDTNSLVTLVFIGIFAFATAKGYLHGYLSFIISNPTLLEWSALLGNITMNLYVVVAVLAIVLFFLVKKLNRLTSLWDGLLVGLLIAAAWYVTGVIGAESIERIVNLDGITFVYPSGQTIDLFANYGTSNLTFPITVLLGVVIGAFLMAKVNKRYSFGCTANKGQNKVKLNMIGGALMGTGGVLSIGCTVGQGLTGLSTLAFASAIAIISIFVSATITALWLNKKSQLPMCFIFEWKDNTPDYQI
jgi:uncharacterized protein